MNKRLRDYLLTATGLALLGAGLFLIKAISYPQGIMRTLPYVFVGIGSGVFGSGMGNLISARAIKNNPGIQKQIEINKNDERNLAISRRAKAKAYDMMVFVFGALMLSFALMEVDLAAILLLVFSYLFVVFYGVYCRCKYEKEM